ncbi:MAG: translation initiation factor IF-1 [bacterium]|nr:translation initiation factor IF-1 [bacterium]
MVKTNEKGKIVLGTVMEALPNAMFRVFLDDGKEILAHLAGKMRLYRIKVMVGNKVRLELSSYGEDKGRIIQRL